MAYCLHCGKDIPDGESVCKVCDTVINTNTQQSSQQLPSMQLPNQQTTSQQDIPDQVTPQQVTPHQTQYQQPTYQQTYQQKTYQQQQQNQYQQYQQTYQQQQQNQYQQYQQAYQQQAYQQTPYQQQYDVTDYADAPSAGFAFLGFLFPILGFILWLVWKDKTPRKAKSCGKGALISFIINVVFYIVIFIAAMFS